MIEHIWTVLCQKSVIDQTSNTYSLFNLLEQINVEVGPSLQPAEGEHPRLFPFELDIVTFWSRKDIDRSARGRSRFFFIGPSGQESNFVEYEIDLAKYKRFRGRIHWSELPAESGIAKLQVQLRIEDKGDWVDVASVPLELVVTVQQQPADSN